MSRVVVIKGVKPVEMVVKALETLKPDINDVFAKEKPVLIKPNYINSKPPSTGITTDGRVVEGVVKFLKASKIENIIIGEGSGLSDTYEAFKVAGIDKVAQRWGAKLIDLNKDEFVEVNPPSPLSLKKVEVAKTALESTIISVPKLKPHRGATVTLSLKNMMGALASKGVMHNGHLSQNIADLASVLRPSVSVVDGIIAGECHELSGNPLRMNLVIAGIDPVAVDSVGATVMGIQPCEVEHLVLAEKKGLGKSKLEEITLLGEPLENVKRRFRRSF
jgi:uncharacterized protein (DUF362 family)